MKNKNYKWCCDLGNDGKWMAPHQECSRDGLDSLVNDSYSFYYDTRQAARKEREKRNRLLA